MTFTAVVTSHSFEQGLRHMLGCLRYQTRPPDETLVFCSGTDLARLKEDFPDVEFHPRENLEDWGHTKRAEGIRLAASEYLGFFNDDDDYDNDYVQRLLYAADQFKADVVYCDWTGVPDCHLALGSSTSGNFIVRSELARRVGWQNNKYEADGEFIDSLGDATDRIVKVSELMYRHNALVR